MAFGIDLNRGVITHYHPSSMEVHMYRDSPGVFIDGHGRAVPEEVARGAGFNVEKYSRLRIEGERKAAFNDKLAVEMGQHDGNREIIIEEGGYQIVSLGAGNHDLMDPDGNKLNPVPMSLTTSEILMAQMLSLEVEMASDAPEDVNEPSEYEAGLITQEAEVETPTPVAETKQGPLTGIFTTAKKGDDDGNSQA